MKSPFEADLEALLGDSPSDGQPPGDAPAPQRLGEASLDEDRFRSAAEREALDRARRAAPLDRSVFRLEGPLSGPPTTQRRPMVLLLLGTALALAGAAGAYLWLVT